MLLLILSNFEEINWPLLTWKSLEINGFLMISGGMSFNYSSFGNTLQQKLLSYRNKSIDLLCKSIDCWLISLWYEVSLRCICENTISKIWWQCLIQQSHTSRYLTLLKSAREMLEQSRKYVQSYWRHSNICSVKFKQI